MRLSPHIGVIFIALFISLVPRSCESKSRSISHNVDRAQVQRKPRLSLRGSHKGSLVLGPSSSKVKLGEVYISGVDRLQGEKGETGPKGRRGMRGMSGSKGSKGDCCGDGALYAGHLCTTPMEGAVRYSKESESLQLCSKGKWQSFMFSNIVFPNSPPRKSCLEVLFLGESRGDGMYWLNPSGLGNNHNAFRAYCDMTTSGGGWTLVAKVTHDYSWVCPERGGAMCYQSNVNPLNANLFHQIHQRDTVDLSIRNDRDAGVHLNNSVIRKIFVSGRQSLRLTFVNSEDGWTAAEDAYAAFHPGRENKMFVDNTWDSYSRQNLDYTWNSITHARKNTKFDGQLICWGNKVQESYRFYDHGLHVGSPALSQKPCHLANDEHEVMLKSHYAMIEPGPPLKGHWDIAQFGFLRAKFVQVSNRRIAVWVR